MSLSCCGYQHLVGSRRRDFWQITIVTWHPSFRFGIDAWKAQKLCLIVTQMFALICCGLYVSVVPNFHFLRKHFWWNKHWISDEKYPKQKPACSSRPRVARIYVIALNERVPETLKFPTTGPSIRATQTANIATFPVDFPTSYTLSLSLLFLIRGRVCVSCRVVLLSLVGDEKYLH